MEVGGGNGRWLVGLAELQEGSLFEAYVGGKWAEIGALASLSEGSDPLHCICRLRFFLEQTTEGVWKSCRWCL